MQALSLVIVVSWRTVKDHLTRLPQLVLRPSNLRLRSLQRMHHQSGRILFSRMTRGRKREIMRERFIILLSLKEQHSL